MSPSEERINAVADAIKALEDRVYNPEDLSYIEYAEAVIATADATRPKLEVTDAAYDAFVQGYSDCQCPDGLTMLSKCCDIAGLEAALKVMQP